MNLDNLTESLGGIPWDVPVRVLLIVIIALIAQIIAVRSIKLAVKRATQRATRLRPSHLRTLNDTSELSSALLEQRTVQRANAMGTLLRSAIIIVIWVIALMMILSTLGVDVGPLLASAGVLGVVIGFGAQTLVADYLAGISMTFEDQLGVGDVVDLGVTTGVVEEVALRYTRVRDFMGVVWYVRNGQIQYVANQSQGWIFTMVDIPVPLGTDIEHLTQVIDDAGKAMLADHDFDNLIIDAPTSAGIEQMDGSQMVVRIVAKAVPENQFAATRAVRAEMKKALDSAGIKIPVTTMRITENNPFGQAKRND
ncbi:MAG: hypothetical protein RJB01_720 [Actinomycetota bacterium]|jgi:small conductance mechanosensitive channel